MDITQADTTPGGIMTEEVGAITGSVEIVTEEGSSAIAVYVRYTGTDENYTVVGSPVGAGVEHARVVWHLTSPERGRASGRGNPPVLDATGLSE